MLKYVLLGAAFGVSLFALALMDNVFAEPAPDAAAQAPGPTAPVPRAAGLVSPQFPTVLTRLDLQNVREVCQLAQKTGSLTLEQATSIGTYCQDLLARLGNALSAPPPAAAQEPGK